MTDDQGIRCPRCNCPRSEVTHTRKKWGRVTIRYRICRFCRARFRTSERLINTRDATSGTNTASSAHDS